MCTLNKLETTTKRQWQVILLLALAGLMLLSRTIELVGCSKTDNGSGSSGGSEQAREKVSVRVASLKGPTSIGLVDFMEKVDKLTLAEDDGSWFDAIFDFTIYGTADEIVPRLISGDIDIALLPANLAAVLYNRTDGGIRVINITTLGVLYVVSADDSITSLSDLAGRTILMTGKGTTPEYVMNHLLSANGLTGNVALEYKSEATELAAAINADPTAIAVLPEPYVSVVTNRNPDLSVRLSLTDEWARIESENQLVTAVTVVRTEFLNEYPKLVSEFFGCQYNSVAAVNANPAAAAELVVKYGIIDDATVATNAIPRCNLVCLTNTDMQAALQSYLNVLYQADPGSIGGKIPDDDFYYTLLWEFR